ncbi:hypothetical protein PR001_g3207 [Phytophthora rubi]|uniref:Uncharacterized protein n=1 Tax=Phytophthora rubi TaxID=129364 RepID=A0A6A3II11_9STRA|nr:hypothetical protein PR002_g24211 [Phytophthora rubi]KAE9049534.1 hypothetical protein PR001_g3207 [Phytophthora rubi]
MLRDVSRLVLKAPKKVITLPYWSFVVWWIIILSVHVVVWVFNGLYAYGYWKLDGSYLNLCLEFYHIGMPHPYHRTIAIVHGGTSTIHGVCILLMVGGSLQQKTLAFTPWSSSTVSNELKTESRGRDSSALLQSFSKAYTKVTYSCSLCGVNGKYFDAALVGREIVETALQTFQAYRMSMLLPRTLLNRFYVILLAANCWSSLVADSVFFGRDEARRRFACIVLDCILDLMSCMGVVLLVLLSYVGDYNSEVTGFDEILWYNDEWVARALNELRIVVVDSWSDLLSRTIFSIGLVITTTSMKRLLWSLPRNGNRVAQSATSIVVAVKATQKFLRKSRELTSVDELAKLRQTSSKPSYKKWMRTRGDRIILRAVYLLFGTWGVVVLGLHIHASLQQTLPQCFMQASPESDTR